MAETKTDEPKKKNPLQKLKEGLDDKEEQLQVLSTFVRLGVVIWSGFILTLNYIELPGLGKQERIDPTFIASVFTGCLATFSVDVGKKKKEGKDGSKSPSSSSLPTQILRIEQAPIKIVTESTGK